MYASMCTRFGSSSTTRHTSFNSSYAFFAFDRGVAFSLAISQPPFFCTQSTNGFCRLPDARMTPTRESLGVPITYPSPRRDGATGIVQPFDCQPQEVHSNVNRSPSYL